MMSFKCPFCLADEDQMFFLRNELFTAIYNKSPILPGHSLVIPNRHVERFDQLTEMELQEVMIFTKRVVERLNIFFPNSGFDWTIQDGAPAGQTVNHFHIHIIPRTDSDLPDPGDWYPLLENSDNPYLDSQMRPKLNGDQLLEINRTLRNIN